MLSASQVNLDRSTTSSQSPNHDRLAELRCWGTLSVEHSLPAALHRPEISLCTFKRQLKAHLFHIWKPANRRNVPHCPTLLLHFCDSGAAYKTTHLLTYLQIYCYRYRQQLPLGTSPKQNTHRVYCCCCCYRWQSFNNNQSTNFARSFISSSCFGWGSAAAVVTSGDSFDWT